MHRLDGAEWTAYAGSPVEVTDEGNRQVEYRADLVVCRLGAVIRADRRCTVVYDRGGYSPAVFTEIIAAGFDVLTYFKAPGPARPPTRSGRWTTTARRHRTHLRPG